jgi:uncharacterized membrane protein
MLTRRRWLHRLDTARIEEAIARAEQRTSAEIRVSVAPYFLGNVQRMARRAFERLGMARTRGRSGVLFLIVPSRRKFAVVGDEAVHACAGQTLWDELRAILSDTFHDDCFTDGLVAAIDRAGERLALCLPAVSGDNPDELPNAVDFVRPGL